MSSTGGWDPETSALPSTAAEQIEQAFKNVDLNLRNAGGKGWSQVFRINSYHVPLEEETLELMSKAIEKWMPNHRPIWTTVGVPNLGLKEMLVEIEVVAHVGV